MSYPWRQTFGLAMSLLFLTATLSTASEPVELAKETKERCLEILREGIQSDEFWPSMHAAEALTLAGHPDEVLKALAGRLEKEMDDQKRCGLAREQVRAGDRSMTTAMLDILAKEDPYGHVHAAESLFKVAQVGDGKLLKQAVLRKENIKLQLMAAGALIRCGDSSKVEIIRGHLRGSDPDGRQIAAWLLARLGDKSDIPQLQKNLDAETDPLRRTYIENALACLGDARGMESFKTNLRHADPGVRTYAADFAGPARATQAVPRLIEMLDDEVLDVRVRAAQSLQALSQPAESAPEEFAVTVYPANAEHPRLSEGDVIVLRDGTLLYATTQFHKGGDDSSTAQIIARPSRDQGRTWGPERVLQPNVGGMNVMSVSLFRLRTPRPGANSPIGMFYLVKNTFEDLDVYLRVSEDEAETFGEPILVTDEPGYHVMNNARVQILSTGRIVCPVATTPHVHNVNHFQCVCWMSDDGGKTWRKGKQMVDLPKRGAMEPDLAELADGRLMLMMRNQLGTISTAFSEDGGDSWSAPSQLSVQAPEAPSTCGRIPATGDLLLVWNNNYSPKAGHGGKRTPLTIAVSSDEGKSWKHIRNIETSEANTFAYTSITFDRDLVLLSYYVADEKTGLMSSRFRSIPVRKLYE